jgi:hypothetical protein
MVNARKEIKTIKKNVRNQRRRLMHAKRYRTGKNARNQSKMVDARKEIENNRTKCKKPKQDD